MNFTPGPITVPVLGGILVLGLITWIIVSTVIGAIAGRILNDKRTGLTFALGLDVIGIVIFILVLVLLNDWFQP